METKNRYLMNIPLQLNTQQQSCSRGSLQSQSNLPQIAYVFNTNDYCNHLSVQN